MFVRGEHGGEGKRGNNRKLKMEELPPPAPPYTGGETNARRRYDVTMRHILPLCKGELEGVVGKIKTKS